MNSCFALIDVDPPHEESFLSFGSTGHQRRTSDILDAQTAGLVPGGVKCKIFQNKILTVGVEERSINGRKGFRPISEQWMRFPRQGKVALVTGAAGGIGLATEKAFALAGASVVVAGLTTKACKRIR